MNTVNLSWREDIFYTVICINSNDSNTGIHIWDAHHVLNKWVLR